MKKFIEFLTLTLFIIYLGGCSNAYTRSDAAKAAKTELIGMTKEKLLSCAGVPDKSYISNETEFFSYRSGGSTSYSVHTTPAIGGYKSRTRVSSSNRYCDITITLKNNRVREISYSGKTGALLSKDSQCAYALEKCAK